MIVPNMDSRMGSNINGPSLIKVPDWIDEPLGKYYLYFAHHSGTYIRLAYSDELSGPWKTYKPGTLQLEQSYFNKHIASPEIYVDHKQKEIRMYYHGSRIPDLPGQYTRVAVSKDGLHFKARPDILGTSYWRVFKWRGYFYALAMSGMIYRSKNGISDFEEGPVLFVNRNMRHSAVKLCDNVLYVFYTVKGDCPERILLSKIILEDEWWKWRESEPKIVLEPEMDYEGGNLPLKPSKPGAIHEPVRQLRDPAIYEEDGNTYLLYSVAGEHGIAIAQLLDL